MPEQTERKYRLFRRKKSILAIDNKPANTEDTQKTPSRSSSSASPLQSSKSHTGSTSNSSGSKPSSPLSSKSLHQSSTFKFKGFKSLLHSNSDHGKSSKRKNITPKAAITDSGISPSSSTSSSPSPSVKKIKASKNDNGSNSTTNHSNSPAVPSAPTEEIKKLSLGDASKAKIPVDIDSVQDKDQIWSTEVNASSTKDPYAIGSEAEQTTTTTIPVKSNNFTAPQLDTFSVTSSITTNTSGFKVQGLARDSLDNSRSHISSNSSVGTTVVGDFDDDNHHHDNSNKAHAQSFFGNKQLGTMASSALRSQEEEEEEVDQLETISLDVKNNVTDKDDESVVDITHFSNRPNKKDCPNDIVAPAGYSWLLIATTTTAVVITSGIMAYRTFKR